MDSEPSAQPAAAMDDGKEEKRSEEAVEAEQPQQEQQSKQQEQEEPSESFAPLPGAAVALERGDEVEQA